MSRPKKLSVTGLARLQGFVFFVFGLAAGVLYSFGGFIYDLFNGSLGVGTALAFFALPIMPILFASVGLVLGGVTAFVYNLLSRWIEDIKLEL